MAGFEVVVRPVVFPNIRPTPKRSLAPEADPEKGICEIRGSSGRIIDLPYSWSVSTSKGKAVESERRFDEVRVYQMDDDGTVNRDNFVDVQVANRIKTKEPGGGGGPVSIPDVGSGTPGTGSSLKYEERVTFYNKATEAANIEIRREAVIPNPIRF